MRSLKTFSGLPEAFLQKSRLADAGIETFVAGENTGTIGYGGAFNEIRLLVAEEDWDRALALLDAPPEALPPDAEIEGTPPPGSPALHPRTLEPPVLPYFVTGGFSLLLLFSLLAVISIALGGRVEGNFGGLLALFLTGGFLGVVARVFYVRGLRRGRKTEGNKD